MARRYLSDGENTTIREEELDETVHVDAEAGGGGGGGAVPLFSASRDVETGDQTSGSTAIFDLVDGSLGTFNEDGSGYDPETGIFTAPANGTYLFRCSFRTTTSEGAFVTQVAAICVDGTPYAFDNAVPDGASNLQVPIKLSLGPIRLTQGQTVFVRRNFNYGGSSANFDTSTMRVRAAADARFEGWRLA